MKVYVGSNGLKMVGKAWQIRAKLKQYMQKHETVQQVIKANHNTMKHSKHACKHDRYSFIILSRK